MTVAVISSLAVHGALGFYLWKAKFEPHYRDFEEQQTDVMLVKPLPPPPPPELEKPPPKPLEPSRPPPVQPRPPRSAVIAEIPPLPIPPVVERVVPESPPVAPAPPTPAPAKPSPPKPVVITQPDWLRIPSADDLARYYPERAQRMGMQGRAVINCSVTTAGTLQSCSVANEAPDDQGFGQAALRMSRIFRMKPMSRDGVPVANAQVVIPIKFVLPA